MVIVRYLVKMSKECYDREGQVCNRYTTYSFLSFIPYASFPEKVPCPNVPQGYKSEAYIHDK